MKECPFQIGQRVRFADITNNQDAPNLVGQCGVVTNARLSYNSPKEWMIYVDWEDKNLHSKGGRYAWRFEAMDGPW